MVAIAGKMNGGSDPIRRARIAIPIRIDHTPVARLRHYWGSVDLLALSIPSVTTSNALYHSGHARS